MRLLATKMAILACLLLAVVADATVAETRFFVATVGDDDNVGSEDLPFASMQRAQAAVRSVIAKGLKSDVTVWVRDGIYRLDEPLVFGPEDSGSQQHSVTYSAFPGETVVISGGRSITGWQRGEGNLWRVSLPTVAHGEWYFRHLFVNERRAVRARTPNLDADQSHWQLTGASLAPDLSRHTLSLGPGTLDEWTNGGDIEVMVAGHWAINRLPVQSIDPNTGLVVLSPPHAVGHDAIRPKPGRWCNFEGAIEMLDQRGEWHLDRQRGVLTYRPLKEQDMTRAEVIAPALEYLLRVQGRSDSPVRNLHFNGIHFQHTGLDLPQGGYMGVQACHHIHGNKWTGTWRRVPAAIRWDYVVGASLEDCELAHLAGCGIELVSGCVDNLIGNNHLKDISGNGIMLGGPQAEDEVPKRNRISRNHVHDCGVEFYGAVGIWIGFAQQTVISHNLVHGLPYSGISIGWQWDSQPTAAKENIVEYNHVYDVMNRLGDGGCIYTLGLQPGTIIRGNHLHDVHRSRWAQGAPNNGMFIDQGSQGYLFERNVIYNTAAELVRFNQCAREWHTWRDNHFGDESEVKKSGREIIDLAGREP